MRTILGRALERLPGVRWDEAVDGVDALRKLRRVDYDCVLLDLNMPRMDGLKLIERIRAPHRARRPRVVVVTTGRATRDRERAVALGAEACLIKPVKLDEVAALVGKLLDV